MQRESLSSLTAGLMRLALAAIAAIELPPLHLFPLQRSDIAFPGRAALSALFWSAADFPQPRLTQPDADSIDIPGWVFSSPNVFEINPNVKDVLTQAASGAVIYAVLTASNSESPSFASQCGFSFQSTRAGPAELVLLSKQRG